MVQVEKFADKLRPFQDEMSRSVKDMTESLRSSLEAGDPVAIAGAAMQLWGRRVPCSVISASLPRAA